MTNENISVTEVQNENSVIAERRAKLLKLREHGVAYPNDFVRKDLFGDLNEKYGNKTAEELAALAPKVACAGRVMLKRVMSRLTFATVREYGDNAVFRPRKHGGRSRLRRFQDARPRRHRCL